MKKTVVILLALLAGTPLAGRSIARLVDVSFQRADLFSTKQGILIRLPGHRKQLRFYLVPLRNFIEFAGAVKQIRSGTVQVMQQAAVLPQSAKYKAISAGLKSKRAFTVQNARITKALRISYRPIIYKKPRRTTLTLRKRGLRPGKDRKYVIFDPGTGRKRSRFVEYALPRDQFVRTLGSLESFSRARIMVQILRTHRSRYTPKQDNVSYPGHGFRRRRHICLILKKVPGK